MKKIILFLFIICIRYPVFAQVNFTGSVPYSYTTDGYQEGLIADLNITLSGTASTGGVYISEKLNNVQVRSFKRGTEVIPGSHIPSHILNIFNDGHITVKYDLYVNNRLIERYGQPSVGWGSITGSGKRSNILPPEREKGYELYNSGALSIRNVRIIRFSYVTQNEFFKQKKAVSASNNPTNPVNGSSQNVTIGAQNNSGASNPVTSNASKSYELKNSDIGLPDKSTTPSGNPNPMINYNTNTSTGSSALNSFNKGYQQGQQIADVATGIADLFAPTPAQLQRRVAKEAEYERQKKVKHTIEEKEKEERFGRLYYYPLMDKAKNGDENARMTLYYASYHLWCTEFVPQREEWLKQAYRNNNTDAILELSNKADKELIPYLEYAASLGSLDAMVRLAKLYDYSPKIYPGSDAKLAIEWFTKAAENGSPNAMYYLGMIYKYGIIEDLSTGGIRGYRKKMHVRYNVTKDEKKAFEWFSKSIQPDYKESIYSRGTSSYYRGSYFEKESYKELAIMYKKGKSVAQDKEKAKELEYKYKNYKSDEGY